MIKVVNIPGYNYRFNTENGMFARWGETMEQDPNFSPIGPEIADIEISTVCNGPGTPCSFCYKSNSSIGQNMSLDTFKNILSKIKGNLTQIAFGIGDIDGNPDMMAIFEHCRENGIIPNVTINGYRFTSEWAKKLSSICGAVAVSHYNDGIACFKAIELLVNNGLQQVNIHKILAEETFNECCNIIETAAVDKKINGELKGLNAVVFLAIKPKGRASNRQMNPISLEKLRELMLVANKSGIGIGFDSCTAPKVLCTVKDQENLPLFKKCVEPCESTLFSSYINVVGDFYPCSFAEGEGDWTTGLSVVNCNDFLKEIWYYPKIIDFRNKLIATESLEVKNCYSPCRKCPVYDIY